MNKNDSWKYAVADLRKELSDARARLRFGIINKFYSQVILPAGELEEQLIVRPTSETMELAYTITNIVQRQPNRRQCSVNMCSPCQ